MEREIIIRLAVPRWLKRRWMALIAAFVVGSAALAFATVPNTFNAGDLLSSKKLNDNFASLVDLSSPQTVAGSKTWSGDAVFNGNVGIQVPAGALAQLQVRGFMLSSNQSAANDYEMFSMGYGMAWDAQNSNYHVFDPVYHQETISDNASGQILFTLHAGALSNPQTYAQWHAYDRMVINNSGAVGIGTTNPFAKGLEVVGANSNINSYGNVYVRTTDAQATGVGGMLTLGGNYTDGGSYTTFATVAGRKETATSDNQAGYLAFGTTNSSSANIERMRIDSSGKVGIGTTTPLYPLDVSTSVASGTTAIRFTNSSNSPTADTRIILANDASYGGLQLTSSTASVDPNSLTLSSPPSGGSLIFLTAGSEAARILQTGHVGIGTTTPGALLQVGTATCNGTTWTNASSRDYKANIRPLDNPLGVLSKINVYRYRFRPGRGDDPRERIGVVAEELPDEVAAPDHKGAPTAELIALSLAANRALVQKLQAQEARIERLEAALRVRQETTRSGDLRSRRAGLAPAR
jgi:hypothetical protein